MYRFGTLIFCALVSFGNHAHADRYADPFSDCEPVWINGHYECEKPHALVSSQHITQLIFVVIVPILLIVLFRGVFGEQRISDEEWQKRYPGRDLWTRDKKPLGIGFYLLSAYLIMGVAFFWLLFVAPETLKVANREIAPLDMTVAAIAGANDCVIVTDNEKDFGLRIVNPIRDAAPKVEL